MLQKFSILFSMLLVVFSIGGHAKTKELNIAIIQEWSSFNPLTNQLASNEALFPFFYRQIVFRAADGSSVADLAESIPKLDQKNVAVWRLKSNAKWADGTAITCADWHLGWQIGLSPKTSVLTRSIFSKISNIEWAPAKPQTCTVTYATRDWAYDRDLPQPVPAHLEKAVFEKFKNDPEGYDRNTVYISNPINKGLYNGPYYVSEFRLGSHFILTLNPFFYGRKPQIEKVIVKLISDTSALKANLLANQINAVSAVGFPPDTALLFDEEFKRNNAPYVVRFQNSGIFQGIYFNLEKEIFKDAKVREALSRAVDKESIVKAFFNNNLEVAEGLISSRHPAYTKRPTSYSIRKSNELLDQAGWKLNDKGVREKNGKALSFVFKTSAGLKVLENIQVYVCEKFKSIGAQCVIKNEPPRTLLGQSVPRGEFDLAMYGQPFPNDTTVTTYFASSEIPTEKNSWAGGNQIRLTSKIVDQLLADFDKQHDRKKRNNLAKQLDEIFMKESYLIPIYHRREALVLPKGLTGVTDSFEGTTYITPENWKF